MAPIATHPPGLMAKSLRRRTRGSALLLVSVLLCAISIAAWYAVPGWRHRQWRAQADRTVAELQQFAAAFQTYAHDHGDWPESNAGPGAFPPGMEPLLKQTRWLQPSPIGGRYVWLTDTPQLGQRVHAVIAVVSVAGEPVSNDKRLLEELIQRGVKAGPSAHPLRLGFRNEPIYILEQ